MIIDTYTRIPNRVQAVQLTPENVEDVANWCGGKVDRIEKPGDPSDVRIQLFVPNISGLLTADVSRKPFIVKESDGRFWIRDANAFLGEYEKPTRTREMVKEVREDDMLVTPKLTPHYVTRGAYPNV